MKCIGHWFLVLSQTKALFRNEITHNSLLLGIEGGGDDFYLYVVTPVPDTCLLQGLNDSLHSLRTFLKSPVQKGMNILLYMYCIIYVNFSVSDNPFYNCLNDNTLNHSSLYAQMLVFLLYTFNVHILIYSKL